MAPSTQHSAPYSGILQNGTKPLPLAKTRPWANSRALAAMSGEDDP